MTNPNTICECGHKSNRHHIPEFCDPAYKTTSRECMFQYSKEEDINESFCDCEYFFKKPRDIFAEDSKIILIDGVVCD